MTPSERSFRDAGVPTKLDRYPAAMRLVHWLMAVVVIVGIACALSADDAPREERARLIGLHIAVASSVLILLPLRLALRWVLPVPPLPPTMAAAARAVAHGAHGLMYLLLALLPLSGWLTRNAGGHEVSLMNWIELPRLIGEDRGWHEFFEEAHDLMGWTLIALIVLHALAALKHHFVDRDGVLLRMLPQLARRRR